MGVRVPQVADIRAAIELYWKNTEIGTNDICRLFGVSRERAGKLKELARVKMREEHTINYNPLCVNTEVAYEVWGIPIRSLEKRYAKLKEYGAYE